MSSYLAYIRVSTVKQGEKGSSLDEQRAAIETYAQRHHLEITEWFEELETAAKQGRPVFLTMLKALQSGKARGVITHKIDRSARNLKDWAALGDLIDRGIEMHFAHESIDLSSRGGRLSADIQAVVAADYIRNLREEVRKGFYGRLHQGLYPLQAPIGYLDQGGGRPKTIDPVRGPLIAKAFELYASGSHSLHTLQREMHSRGLRTKHGKTVTRNGLSTIFNNCFYTGIIRIAKTSETFQGVHEPLVDRYTFDRVQSILKGRVTHRTRHKYRYQRLLYCSLCEYALIAERQKGRVYYRCHTPSCATTTVREDRVDATLSREALRFRIDARQHATICEDIAAMLQHSTVEREQARKSLSLNVGAVDQRIGRLTDAYIDQIVDRDTYLQRKEQLLAERARLSSRLSALTDEQNPLQIRVQKILELLKTLGNHDFLNSDDELGDLLKQTTSNLRVSGKNLYVAWRKPFDKLSFTGAVTTGGPARDEPRTFHENVSNIIFDHVQQEEDDG